MTTPDGQPPTVGAVVWVRPRLPEYRYQGWKPAGCWPATVVAVRETGHAAGTQPSAWWIDVQPCTGGYTVALMSDRDNVAHAPCETCAGLWAAAQWAMLRSAGARS